MNFSDNISDFYHWMVQFGNVNTKSRTNYISWLKFMAGRYELDVDLSEDKIQTIINDERRALSSRTIYKSEKDLVNFKSALLAVLQGFICDAIKMFVSLHLVIEHPDQYKINRSRNNPCPIRDFIIAFFSVRVIELSC